MSNKKMTTTISREGLEKLTKYTRMYSYLMSSFAKTYVAFNEDDATFYFKGNKSLVSISVPLEHSNPEICYISVDISKFLSAAKKVAGSDSLNLTLNASTLKLSSNVTNDKITLSVVTYADTEDEISTITSFYANREARFENGATINVTEDFRNFISIASTYMSTINKNNSVAIFNDKMMYADRTIVLSLATKVLEDDIADEPILMHKFILNFIEFVAGDTPAFIIDEQRETILWKSAEDDNFWAILSIDPCSIAIPQQADIDMITPEDTKQQTVIIKPSRMMEAIDFFNGLFEASVWKPITFFWNYNNADQKIKLTYHHPSTEVEKDLICEEFVGNLEQFNDTASFILISDSIRTLVSKLDPAGNVKLIFNDEADDVAHGAGVKLIYESEAGNELYTAVMAKLQDA